MKCRGSFVILNEKGLHTRPCTELVKCVGIYKSQVTLTYQNMNVNARSLLDILMFAAGRGARIHIEAEGDDAEEVVKALITLARNKFHIKY